MYNIPLIELLPPRVLPLGQLIDLLFKFFSGSVSYPQPYFLFLNNELAAKGILIDESLFIGPASITRTELSGFSESLLAKTQPALPAPIMIYLWLYFIILISLRD